MNNSILNPSSLFPSSPPLANISLSSIFDKQTELNDYTFKDIEPSYSNKGKEKVDKEYKNNINKNKRYKDEIIIGATSIRDSFKYIINKVGLNKSNKNIYN